MEEIIKDIEFEIERLEALLDRDIKDATHRNMSQRGHLTSALTLHGIIEGLYKAKRIALNEWKKGL